MGINDLGDFVPVIVIASGVIGGILWLIKAQNAMLRQFHPNGGNSMKDQLNRLERDLRDHSNRLNQHIDKHH
jgi:hypothetical protein